MAKARDVPGLDEQLSYAEAAARAVAVRAEEVFEHGHGALDLADIEGVHDMRVATRRLRAALEIFAPCFPKREHRAVLRDVKALADVLGERRDPDVAIQSLERISAALTAEDRPGIAHLVGDLRARQRDANIALAHCLAEVERNQLEQRLKALAEAARSR